AVERVPKRRKGPRGGGAVLDGAISSGTAGYCRDLESRDRRLELCEKLGLPSSIGLLPRRMCQLEVRGGGVDRPISEERPAKDIVRQIGETMAGGNAFAIDQLFDRDEATFGQDGMIARELDVRLAVRIRLRARKAESEDPPAAQRRRVPSSDPARFDATIGADGHDCAVVAITNETPDPSPAAVTELN